MNEDRLNSLLSIWQEQQSRGRDLKAADLCRDCPELAEALDQRIQVLRQMNALVQPGGVAELADSADANLPAATGNIQTDSANPKMAETACKPDEERPAPAPPLESVPGFGETKELSNEKGENRYGQEPTASFLPVSPSLPDRERNEFAPFLNAPESTDEIGRLGNYRVLKLLGMGGMGIVFEAEDIQLRRGVALKLMKPTLAANPTSRQRFLREARAAAAVDNDHVVPIYQVGEDAGVPFLAMQLLDGTTLADRIKQEGRLPMDQVCRIGLELSLGLQAAHGRGLIHRDIKPANIWLQTKDEGGRRKDEKKQSGQAPDSSLILHPSSFRVKILDFGLARNQEGGDDSISLSGDVLGTPAYMSPEQASSLPVDHRTDLFSVGCVLYELSTGRRPFAGANLLAICRNLAMHNPPQPKDINEAVPARLSELIVALLAKDPADRPSSAHEVATALKELAESLRDPEQGTTSEMIAGSGAGPGRSRRRAAADPVTKTPGRTETESNRSKIRKPVLLALAGGLMAVIAAVIVFFWPTPHGVIRVEINDPDIEAAFAQNGLTFKGRDRQLIEVTPDKEIGLHIKRGDLAFDTDKFILKKGETITLKIEWFSEGKLQVGQGDKVIGVKSLPPQGATVDPFQAKNDLAKKSEIPSLPDLPKEKEKVLKEKTPAPPDLRTVLIIKKFQHNLLSTAAVSGDGEYVLTGSSDGTAILWEAATGKRIQTFQVNNIHYDVRSVALSGDSKHVLTGSADGKTILWDVATGKKIQTFLSGVCGVALSGDSKRVLIGNYDKTVVLWEAANSKKIQTFEGHTNAVMGVSLSGDGSHVLTGSWDQTAILWETASGSKLQTFEGHTAELTGVALSSDGKLALTGAKDKTAILWEAVSGKKLQTFQGHTGPVMGVALSGDGKYVLTGSEDRTAILWEAASGTKIHTFQEHSGPVRGVALNSDGKRVLTGSFDGTAILWEVNPSPLVLDPRTVPKEKEKPKEPADNPVKVTPAPLQPLYVSIMQTFRGHAAPVTSVALSGDGKHVLTGSWDKTAALWDAATGKRLQTYQGHTDQVCGVALSGDGKYAVTGSKDKTTVMWEAATGVKIQTMKEGSGSQVFSVALSGDGKHVLTGGYGGVAILWEAVSGKNLKTFQKYPGSIFGVALSGDGKLALAGSQSFVAFLCDVATGKEIQFFLGHGLNVCGVALSGDGKYVVTGSSDRTAILWDAASGKPLQTFKGHSNQIRSVALSDDCKYVLTGSDDKTAILWEAETGNKLHTFNGHTREVLSVALSGDGKHVLTGSSDKTAILWEVKTSPPPDNTHAQQKDTLKYFTNSLGMKFVWIPPGNFMMGSPGGEKERSKNEILHKVTLSKGFYMGVYPVTQEEWQAVMGDNPSFFKGEKNLPVEQVSWGECQEFIEKLRVRDKKFYRLPTEAEWEYACRAGTTGRFYFGETLSTLQANYDHKFSFGLGKPVIRGKTTPVGIFPANDWGLHDMHGNVSQWCQDWSGDYSKKEEVDPQGPEIGKERVFRGGSWYDAPYRLPFGFPGLGRAWPP